jgi:hypothetical protein
MAVAPGHAHLHTIKILHLDYFLAPRQLVPRHCASAHLPVSCNRDSFPATYQLCTTTRVMLNKISTWTAKTRAIPSLHRDSFLAKVPGPCPVLSSGNTTSLYCRAVSSNNLDISVIENVTYRLAPTLDCIWQFTVLFFKIYKTGLRVPSVSFRPFGKPLHSFIMTNSSSLLFCC